MSTESRLIVRTLAPHAAPATFAEDVRAGLDSSTKSLPPKYFYDELGSKLFEAVCLLPEYYLLRAEREILERSADEIVSHFTEPVELIEMGNGSAEKTRFIIEALLRRQPELHYTPVDISASALETSSRQLLDAYPQLHITAYASDYQGALAQLPPPRRTRLALFLGSNVGNFEREQAEGFLKSLRAVLAPGDALLLGADLKKSKTVLESAYDDPLGITAAFNLNILGRINRELGGRFDLRRFVHEAVYDEQASRIVIHIVSLDDQEVAIEALGLRVQLARGERIHTEYSHKYDLDDLSLMARGSGFWLEQSWFDSENRFSSNLFIAEDA